MNKCELCKFPARTYCESDEANLCWNCDAKVHGANFLVARHTRTLLCRNCQSVTPWKASGPKLGPTVSFCDRCVKQDHDESEADNEDFTTVNGENQAVPSCTSNQESSCSTGLKAPFQNACGRRSEITRPFKKQKTETDRSIPVKRDSIIKLVK